MVPSLDPLGTEDDDDEVPYRTLGTEGDEGGSVVPCPTWGMEDDDGSAVPSLVP